MRIVSLIGKLATHPDKKFGALVLADVEGQALHHTRGRGSPAALARYKVASDQHGHDYHFHDHHERSGSWVMYQTQPLDVRTHHAGDHNRFRWAICITGDYDHSPWPLQVLDQVAELSALLLIWRGHWDPHELVQEAGRGGRDLTAPRVAGHRELPWSSTKIDSGTGRVLKGCPGYAQGLEEVRDRVLRHMMPRRLYSPLQAAEELTAAGVVLPVGWELSA